MSEPRRTTRRAEEFLPGLLHWSVLDDRIQAQSDSYAVLGEDGWVLVDPLRVPPKDLARLDKVVALVLTIQSHQRACWRYRKELGVPVWAPEGARGLEGTPDRSYRDGESLPGDLRALSTPGPAFSAFCLLRQAQGQPRVLFAGDLLVRVGPRRLGFVPDEYMDAPAQARQSARRLLAEDFEALCSGHGGPFLTGARALIEQALEEDQGAQAPPPG